MGSSIIEVGVGLVLVYLLLSLLVSQINNILKNLLNVRGEVYQQELGRLLRDSELQVAILNHPAVNMLREAIDGIAVKNISSSLLTNVLIDLIAGNGETIEMLEGLTNSELVDQIIKSVDNPDLQEQLYGVLRTARDLQDAKDKIAQWFETGLNRAHEVYTRRMQLLSFLCGAILAILLNVDTLYVAQALWNDPVLRQAAVEAANNTYDTTMDPEGTSDDLQGSIEAAQDTMDVLLGLRLPIGWYNLALDERVNATDLVNPETDTRNLWNILPGGNEGWLGLLIAKIVGLLMTTIAVMQGAPFWFDLLRRATGK